MVCVNPCAGGAQSFVSQDYACSSELKWSLFAVALLGTAAAGAATYLGRLPKNVGVGLTLGGAVGAAVAGFWPTETSSETAPVVDLKKLVRDFDAEQGVLVERLEWKEIKDLRLWKKGEMVELLKLCPNLKQIDVSGYPQERDHAEVMQQLAVQPALEEIHCSDREHSTFLAPDEVDEWWDLLENLSESEEVSAEGKTYLSRLTHFGSGWSAWVSNDPQSIATIISHMPRLRVFHGGGCPDEAAVWNALQGCAHLEQVDFPSANARVMREFDNLPAELQLYLRCSPELRFDDWKNFVSDDQWPELVKRMPNLREVNLQGMPKALWSRELVEMFPANLEVFEGSEEVRESLRWDVRLGDALFEFVRLEKRVPKDALIEGGAATQLLELGDFVYPKAQDAIWDGIEIDRMETDEFKLAQAQLTGYSLEKMDFDQQEKVAAALCGAPRLQQLTLLGSEIETLPAFGGMWEQLQVQRLVLDEQTQLDSESMKLLINELRPSLFLFEECGTPPWTTDSDVWDLLEKHYDICFEDDDGLFADDDYATTWTWDYLKTNPRRLSEEVASRVNVVLRRKEG